MQKKTRQFEVVVVVVFFVLFVCLFFFCFWARTEVAVRLVFYKLFAVRDLQYLWDGSINSE
jgi:hypothetical protein